MEKPRSNSPDHHLDLNNFDSVHAESSRYVLTSPRSLESCARLGIKPVALLIKSLNELIAEKQHLPFEAVKVMHESYEKERMRLLQMCRKERERIIWESGGRWPIRNKVSGLEMKDMKDSKDKLSTGPVLYADLCIKGKSASRSPYSAAGTSNKDRSTVCSFSVGDLSHSPNTERKLKKLTKDIKKKMCVILPERDRKIAALMLIKHEEEEASHRFSQQEMQEREQTRKQEDEQHAQGEKKRRRKLRQSMKRWHKELESRKKQRESEEKDQIGKLQQEVLVQEDRWRRLKEEVEKQRKQKMQSAQKEAEERKRYQEKLLKEKEEIEKRERERERQVGEEKEQKAHRSKVLQERKARKRLQEGNRRELLRHVLLKKQIEQQVEEEEARMRSTLERKLQNSHEKCVKAAEARLRELQERAALEEEQIQRAQLKAKLQSVEVLTHKKIMVEVSQRRAERAVLRASIQRYRKAEEVHKRNAHRKICHQRLRERLQREEEALKEIRESCMHVKEWRRERLRRQREEIQEEAHRLARATCHMMERVKQQTQRRTFDRMVLEAQLNASMKSMKI